MALRRMQMHVSFPSSPRTMGDFIAVTNATPTGIPIANTTAPMLANTRNALCAPW